MKIKVNAASWKKAVAKANSLAGKSSNLNESCVQIHIKEGDSYLFVVEAGVHNTKINLDVEIETEGSLYIQATALDNLTKAVFSKEITIESANNTLVYNTENFGSICEPVFHNQAPFHGMVFAQEEYKLIETGSTPFTNLLESGLGVFTDKLDKDTNSLLSISLSPDDESIISGNTSLAGGLVYTFTSTAQSQFTIKTHLIKSVNFILEDLGTLKLEQGATTIKIASSKGEAILAVGKVNQAALTYLVNSFKQEADSIALIKSEELTNIVRWQSYGVRDGDCIAISSDGDNLLIKGDRTQEASKIAYSEATPFNQIKLPTEAFTKTVSNLPKDSVVTLKTTATQIINQPQPIKTALVIIEAQQGYTSTAYLSEPALLK